MIQLRRDRARGNGRCGPILASLKSKHGLTPEQKAQLQSRRRQRDTGVEQGLDWLQA